MRPYCFLYFWLDHNYWLENPPFETGSLFRWGNFVLVGLTMVSVIIYFRQPGPARLLLCVMLGISLFYSVFHADIGHRFRLQIEPIMLIYLGQLITANGLFRNMMRRFGWTTVDHTE